METFSFADIIAPFPVKDFFALHWEKKHLHISRNKDYYLQSVLNVQDIDAFFSQENIGPERINLVKKGVIVPPEEWTNTLRLIDGRVVAFVNPTKVFSLYASGATIIVNAAQKSIPRLAQACASIERELKIELQANIYITPPHSQGFAKHYDIHDIFSMQIKGTKAWQFYDSGEDLPISLAPFSREPQLITKFEMNPGDFLYMPRGLVHEASASGESTIHVNFSHKARYGFHLLEDLIKVAEKEEVFFRRTLPHIHSTEEQKQEYIHAFSRKLQEIITAYPVDVLLKRQDEIFVEKQKPVLKGRLSDMLVVDQLTIHSRVLRRREMVYTIHKEDNGLVIQFGKEKLMIPNWLDQSVFLSEAPFAIKDIKGLVTDKIKIDLVKKCVESGFLKIESL
ncbi:MAG: cupin domain-containing protein [Flavobacteriales bacterium]